MKITPTPIRMDAVLVVSRLGDALTINGAAFDFSTLPDGATIPAGDVPCQWIAGLVSRIDGVLHLTLVLPHGAQPSHAVAFPAPIVDPPDGVIALPFDQQAEEHDDVDA